MDTNKLPGGKFVTLAVNRLSEAQGKFKGFLDKNTAIAKKYANRGQAEFKTRLNDDLGKFQKMIEKERRDLEALQRQIPKEMNKLSKFLVKQTKEVRKVLKTLSKKAPMTAAKATRGKSKVSRVSATRAKVSKGAKSASKKRTPTTQLSSN